MIALSTGKVSVGLGPKNMNALGLVAEDIGLASKLIVQDYPSHTNGQIRYEGANITSSEIEKVKKVCAHPKGKEEAAVNLSLEVSQGYLVEFPPKIASPVAELVKLHEKLETELAICVSKGLTLKNTFC